ncbi:MAG: SGNH/GDSL hydrolase family protein [Soonwooa sp.]
MKKILFSLFSISALLATQSCKTDFDTDVTDVVVTKGDADFTKYVALGNSLTSGYRDNALYSDGQNESYPSMIAQQMKLAGGGEFKQPMMPNNIGGFSNLPGFGGKLNLQIVNGSLTPVPSNPGGALDNITSGGPYQNMGVPGAKVAHLLDPGYGNPAGLTTNPATANPYFTRFASTIQTSVIADFLAQKPTFFSLWIGNNDALLYALAGADSSLETLTPTDQFKTYYNMLIAQIATTKAKGVIANIPDVTTIPNLTTFPYNPLTSSVLGGGNIAVGEATIDKLNTNLYGPLVQLLKAVGGGDRIKMLSKTAANPLLIKDESLQNLSNQITYAAANSGNPVLASLATYLGTTYGQARQAKASDLIPLATRNAIGTSEANVPTDLSARGIAYPFADKYVLTSTEVTEVNSAIASYNETIKAAATANGYAFVDANAKMKELAQKSGIQWNGVKYTATFVTGGAFSLDGVHLTGRGYAIVANEFVNAINNKYKSTLPLVDVNKYSGVKFP